jgi:hypothetical protein
MMFDGFFIAIRTNDFIHTLVAIFLRRYFFYLIA